MASASGRAPAAAAVDAASWSSPATSARSPCARSPASANRNRAYAASSGSGTASNASMAARHASASSSPRDRASSPRPSATSPRPLEVVTRDDSHSSRSASRAVASVASGEPGVHPCRLGHLGHRPQPERDERRRPDHVVEPLERGEARLHLGQRARGILDEEPRLRPDRRHVRRVVRVQRGLVDLGPAPGGLRGVAPDGREPRGRDRQVHRPAPDRIERQAAAHRLGRLVQPCRGG